MELNVMIPNNTSLDFFNMNTNTICSSPYISAPSSPTHKPLNFFYTAPSSPSNFPSISDRFSNHHVHSEFDPNSPCNLDQKLDQEVKDNESEFEFEFEFSGQLERRVRPALSSADELFDGGKIRPLKPPRVTISTTADDHPTSGRNNIDPTTKCEPGNNRGRSKTLPTARANSRRGISRSLSPLRVSEFALHQQELIIRETNDQTEQISSNNGGNSSRWGRSKWRLKDFLLFRSVSERSALTNNKKYLSVISSKKSNGDGDGDGDDNEGSLRWNNGSVSRRRGKQVSAHERHYMKKRLVSEEEKKKTSLPYKPGFMACLGFNPALYDTSKAFGSFNYC